MSEHFYAVVMAGGSGTRFWPLSRRRTPKQLQPIVGDTPLIAVTCERLRGLVRPENILVITGADQDEATRQSLPALPPGNVIAEPEGRDTAAAVALAATILSRRDPEAVMAVMPADHIIRPEGIFQATLAAACDLVQRTDYLLLFGIRPDRPATGYGYIHFGDTIERAAGTFPVRKVERFTEKPDERTAREYFQSEEYYWNSGIFVWRASRILREMAEFLPGHAAAFGRIAAALGTAAEQEVMASEYRNLKKISIDYAILEKARDVAVLEAPYQWDDVGSWLALERHREPDASGNILVGDAMAAGCSGCILHASGKRLVATLDVSNLLVVSTDDVVLICPKDRDQDVKRLVEELRSRGRTELL
jgi:mannose-1-phosphate guanylyltransferase